MSWQGNTRKQKPKGECFGRWWLFGMGKRRRDGENNLFVSQKKVLVCYWLRLHTS